MILSLIKSETIKFYKHLLLTIILLTVIWISTYFIPDLIIISGVLTVLVLYFLLRKLPDFLFWVGINAKYNNQTLKKYVNDEYQTEKSTHNYHENNKTTTVLTSMSNMQYKTQKENYMAKKNNRTRKLLKIKKLLDKEI